MIFSLRHSIAISAMMMIHVFATAAFAADVAAVLLMPLALRIPASHISAMMMMPCDALLTRCCCHADAAADFAPPLALIFADAAMLLMSCQLSMPTFFAARRSS